MVTEADLPSIDEILSRIQRMDDLTPDQLNDEKDFSFRSARTLTTLVEEYTDSQEEAFEDPNIVADTLERLHRHSGAILGHARAVYRKAQHVVYEEMTEGNKDKDSKTKYNQGDRERYAKGRASSMEGLVSVLDEAHTTLGGRLFRQRMQAARTRGSYD